MKVICVENVFLHNYNIGKKIKDDLLEVKAKWHSHRPPKKPRFDCGFANPPQPISPSTLSPTPSAPSLISSPSCSCPLDSSITITSDTATISIEVALPDVGLSVVLVL